MYRNVTIAVIVIVVLVTSHWQVYRKGKQVVRAEWNEATALANEREHEIERFNRRLKEKAIATQTKETTNLVSSVRRANATADRLRIASENSIQESRATHAACLVSATSHAKLLGQCESSYRELAEKADRHVIDIKTLIGAWPLQ